MTSPPTALPAPTTDLCLPGDNTVVEHLARSEFLDIFAVWNHERGCPAVAKVLRPDRREHAHARERLLSEGRHLLRLAHPYLVRAYELHGLPGDAHAGDDVPDVALIMETLTGETLGHLVERRSRRLDIGDLAELGRQLCSVVGYLHRQNVLHLDLKPSNTVIEGGRLRLLDLSHAQEPGRCGPGYGTREYMPPEQLHGGAVTMASDVHGIGGILYRAATLRRPFGRDRTRDDVEVDAALLGRRSLPREFRQLLLDCLAPDAVDRPTVAEVGSTLDRLGAS